MHCYSKYVLIPTAFILKYIYVYIRTVVMPTISTPAVAAPTTAASTVATPSVPESSC